MTPIAKNRHFTLIELLAVMAIIIILAGILIGGLGHASRKADISKTISLMEQLQMAIEEFKDQNGYYPQSVLHDVSFSVDDAKGLQFDVESSYPFVKKGTTRPFLEIGTIGTYEDVWGNAFRYKCSSVGTQHNPTSYDLWSYGPDKLDDTTDDITNWKQN